LTAHRRNLIVPLKSRPSRGGRLLSPKEKTDEEEENHAGDSGKYPGEKTRSDWLRSAAGVANRGDVKGKGGRKSKKAGRKEETSEGSTVKRFREKKGRLWQKGWWESGKNEWWIQKGTSGAERYQWETSCRNYA